MTTFKPRLTAPSSKDKNYIRYDRGGHNYCIHIGNGSVLPNCVGYAWGRWRELLGKYHNLSRGNAEVWYGKNDGYERSRNPRLGSIICWKQGSTATGRDGMGHVAVVEKIHSDGSITTSNSAYGGSKFYLRKIKPPYHMGGNFEFQGFIHLPVKMEVEKPKLKSLDVVAKEVIRGDWGNGVDRKRRLTKAGYNYTKVQQEVDRQLSGKKPSKPKLKPTATIAKEVIRGDWGNGADRKKRLTAAGYNYTAVQKEVDRQLGSGKKKVTEKLAREVIRGDWGNGKARRTKLEKAGYDYNEVQALVNKLI